MTQPDKKSTTVTSLSGKQNEEVRKIVEQIISEMMENEARSTLVSRVSDTKNSLSYRDIEEMRKIKSAKSPQPSFMLAMISSGLIIMIIFSTGSGKFFTESTPYSVVSLTVFLGYILFFFRNILVDSVDRNLKSSAYHTVKN